MNAPSRIPGSVPKRGLIMASSCSRDSGINHPLNCIFLNFLRGNLWHFQAVEYYSSTKQQKQPQKMVSGAADLSRALLRTRLYAASGTEPARCCLDQSGKQSHRAFQITARGTLMFNFRQFVHALFNFDQSPEFCFLQAIEPVSPRRAVNFSVWPSTAREQPMRTRFLRQIHLPSVNLCCTATS